MVTDIVLRYTEYNIHVSVDTFCIKELLKSLAQVFFIDSWNRSPIGCDKWLITALNTPDDEMCVKRVLRQSIIPVVGPWEETKFDASCKIYH